MHYLGLILSIFFFLAMSGAVHGQNSADDIAELRQLLDEMKTEYETRIESLESRLAAAEQLAERADRDAADAIEIAEDTAISMSAGASAANTFNPAIGAVLVARYADIDRGWEDVPGFIPGGELGPGESGFSLGESEINLKSNVDDLFFGNLTLALESEGSETELAVEEAWIQTTRLPQGITVTGGRYFSETGYLNKFHRHADDFVDRPLPYQAFLGGQYIPDGVQARWIAPTPLLVEVGAELDWGSNFPASSSEDSSADAWTLFTNIGGDVGLSNSWQIGLAYVEADVAERVAGEEESDADLAAFTGDSDLVVADFVWKWAPDGNPTVRNFKLQGEYFWRDESGEFAGLPYNGDQDGWYLQGVWQFMPRWRVGYRHDQVDTDNGPGFTGTILEDPASAPKRDTFMVDWSHSEFSRMRLQYVYDRVLPDSDSQFIFQYIMSIGAHGAHEF